MMNLCLMHVILPISLKNLIGNTEYVISLRRGKIVQSESERKRNELVTLNIIEENRARN
jgi:hypothetical protein